MKIIAYGPDISKRPSPSKGSPSLPQYAHSPLYADLLAHYSDVFALSPIVKVEIHLEKPISNKDLEPFALRFGIDLNEFSAAQVVAEHHTLRKALKADGYDGYHDFSILEASEPLQTVAFDPLSVFIAQ